jgi:hypothetical protein
LQNCSFSKSVINNILTVETLNADHKEDEKNMPIGIIVGISTGILTVGIVVTFVLLRKVILKGS